MGSPVGVHSCAQVKGGWGLVRNNDSKVPYGSCVYALGSDARLDCKTRQLRTRQTGTVPPRAGEAPRGVLISRLEQPLHASAHHGARLRMCASCMQVLTTAPPIRSSCAPSMQVLTTAPPSELARPACKCSPRRPALRTCAPCRARRAPRAAGIGAAASPRRDQMCREHLMRCNQMQSDAIIEGNQIPSDPIRSHQIPSDPIRSHQIPSDPIRSHQSPSEPIRANQRPSKVRGARR